jgi:hypothetical protein
MTCALNHRDHVIRPDDFAAGLGSGLYRASRGHVVTPPAMSSTMRPSGWWRVRAGAPFG